MRLPGGRGKDHWPACDVAADDLANVPRYGLKIREMPMNAARRIAAHGLFVGVAALTACGSAGAQDFYKGKDITLYVGSGAGGAYDTYARLIARHYSRHIPGNPNVIVVDMPGASGRKMIGYLYNVAPKDGTAIGTALSTLTFDPLIGEDTQFDAQKLSWIGSATRETTTCIVWHASPIRTIDDVRKQVMTVGSSGPSSTDSIYPNVLNNLFGMKFKVIAGYTSAPLMSMAIEHGELDGRCGLTMSSLHSVNRSWTDEHKVRIILQIAIEKDPQIADVPFIFDLASTAEQRQILTLWAAPNKMGRPFYGPPGVPAERLNILRRAFDAMEKDPAFRADAERSGLGADGITGEEVDALVRQVYATPKDVVAKAAQAAKGK
jgi:tripartite-type tricarboxylate transporter receptor subunit TctC